MEKSGNIFCTARNKHRHITLEDCVPNPYHPACQECASPNKIPEDFKKKGSSSKQKGEQEQKTMKNKDENKDWLAQEFDDKNFSVVAPSPSFYGEDSADDEYYDDEDVFI